METFPAFFPLRGRRVVIAGEGAGAEAKVRLFAGAPAEIVRLKGDAAADPRAYVGACLAFISGAAEDFRRRARDAARAAHVPVNVIDHPELSDFHTPAVIDRGQVVAAIGTAGASPLLASLLRTQVEAQVPEHAGRLAALLGDQRQAVRAAFPDFARRRAFLRAVLEGPAGRAAGAGDMARAASHLATAIAAGFEATGGVSFIVTGGMDDMISLRAARRLAAADVVAAGAGTERLVAIHCRRDAERLEAGDVRAESLAALVSGGALVALVSDEADHGLAGELRRRGITVEVMTPAPPQ